MNSWRCKPLAWISVALVPVWSLCSPAPANEPDRAAIIQAEVVPGDKLLLSRTDGAESIGSFQSLGESNTALLLRVFDPAESRFSTDVIPLQDVASLSQVRTAHSDAYPILGGLAGGAVGAMSGYLLGDDGWGGGDAESADTRAVFAFGLGLTGAFLGFVLGAILAPSKETRVALW